MIASLLQVQHVSLSLGRSPRLLLSDVSFELKPGEMAILLGPRGSGKTLLLQLLNGLRSPSQGQILWHGQALSAQSSVALRRQIVYQPQQPRLLGMTGREAIVYPLQLQGLDSATIQQRLAIWLDILGVPLAWLEQREADLAPLAAQAIALTRSLVMEPQLLLLDALWLRALNPDSLKSDTQSKAPSDTLPMWDKPEEKLEQALSAFLQRGGAVIWAMPSKEHPSSDKAATLAQQLLCLSDGRLISSRAATPAAWQQSIAELTRSLSANSVRSTAPEADEWD